MASLVLPMRKLYLNYTFKIKDIFFLWASSFVSLLLIINLLLKNMWGRVRPNEISQFGGGDIFTPWYQITNQCDNNCSFVSGDASVGFLLILLYFLTKKDMFFWSSLLLGFSLGLIRILEGGLFLSDIMFAFLIVFSFCYWSYKIYIKNFNV